MLKAVAPLALLLVAAQPTLADEFEVATERAGRDGALMRINFSVKSNADKLAKNVFVDCTAFDVGASPVNTGLGLVKSVKPGEKVFGVVNIRYETDMKSAACRYSHASF